MAERDYQDQPEPDSEHEGPDVGELNPGNAQEGFSEEATSVLHFDPFEGGFDGDSAESETSGDGSDGYAGAEQPGESGEGQAQAPAEGSDQGAAAEQGQEETELQRLQRELYERDQLLAQYTQQGQGQGQDQGQAQGQDQGQAQGQAQAQGQNSDQPSIPNYAFRVPDQLWDQIESDDPNERRQGIGQLLQGVAQAVHQQVQTEYQQQLQNLRQQELPQTIQQTVQQREQQREVYQDFYGTYPDLNHPELRQVVQNAGQQEASLRQARGQSVEWGPDFRDAVAQRVYSVLGRQPQGQGQAQAQAQPQRSPRGQPANFGRGSAPRAAPQGEARSQQNDVLDTLFG
jgi:hypothetical protein